MLNQNKDKTIFISIIILFLLIIPIFLYYIHIDISSVIGSEDLLLPNINSREIWVIASSATAPPHNRRKGDNVYLCDGSADDVEIQQAINAAEAAAAGAEPAEVHLSSGIYSLTTPIYIGYASGVPEQTAGCSLIGHGFCQIGWSGSTQDTNKFLINIAPSDSQQYGVRIENLKVWGASKINGIYFHNAIHARVKNILITSTLSMGIVTNDCWTSRYENLRYESGKGIAFFAIGANGVKVDQIGILSSWRDTNLPYMRAYTMDSSPVNDYRLLETVEATGGETGVVVGWAGNLLYVAHDVDDDFDDGDTVTGQTSKFAETVDNDAGETKNCESGVYFLGGTFEVNNINIEQCDFTTTHDCPVVLIDGSNNVSLRNVRSETGTTHAARRISATWIHLRNTDNATIENVRCSGGSYPVVDTVNYTDSSNAIDGVSDANLARLAEGDVIYLWEVDGSDDDFTDGPYVVDTGGLIAYGDRTPPSVANDNEVRFTTDPGGTDDDDGETLAYLLSLSDRDSPVDLIKLENADGTMIRNVWGYSFSNSLVNIDASSDRTTCENVFEEKIDAHQTSGAESNWLIFTKPMQIILNAGTRTTVLNSQTFDATVDPGGNALIYAGSNYDDGDLTKENQKIGFDGIQMDSAATLAIGTAWGPNYRIYLTSTTTITSITGGFYGQTITLIAYAGAVTIEGDGDYIIPVGCELSLICTSTSGDSWEAK